MSQQSMSVDNFVAYARKVARTKLEGYSVEQLATLDADTFAKEHASRFEMTELVVDEERETEASRIDSSSGRFGKTCLSVSIPLVKGQTLELLEKMGIQGRTTPICEAFSTLRFEPANGIAVFYVPDRDRELNEQLPRILEYFKNLNKELVHVHGSVLNSARSIATLKIGEAKSELERRAKVDSKSAVTIVDKTRATRAESARSPNDWS